MLQGDHQIRFARCLARRDIDLGVLRWQPLELLYRLLDGTQIQQIARTQRQCGFPVRAFGIGDHAHRTQTAGHQFET